MEDDQILVTAATGNVGTPLVKALQRKNKNFIAATRDGEKARKKLGESIDTVYHNYEDATSFGPALEDIDLLFLCGPSATPNAPELMMPMIEEAQKQEIKHIVFIAAFPSLMDMIEESGIDYTFIKANFFMQNFELYQVEDIRDRNQIFLPCGKGKVSYIHTRDIGEVAAEILADPGAYRQESLTLTGPRAMDNFEAADIFTNVLGKEVEYANPDNETYREEMIDRGYATSYIEAMIDVFGKIKDGSASHVTPVVEQILDRDPLSLRNYVEEQKSLFGG